MANNQVKFSGSVSSQDKSRLAQALKTNNPEIMKIIPDFFGISEVKYDGGQTTGSRAVILMLRGLRAFEDDFEQRGTLGMQQVLTTQSIPADYLPNNEVEEVIESDMDNFKFIEDEL